ncbi:MAG: hypothetical protein PVJ67_05510 [Candidatus Pacearchaeota archaeon]|jgi:hypothetical protein
MNNYAMNSKEVVYGAGLIGTVAFAKMACSPRKKPDYLKKQIRGGFHLGLGRMIGSMKLVKSGIRKIHEGKREERIAMNNFEREVLAGTT